MKYGVTLRHLIKTVEPKVQLKQQTAQISTEDTEDTALVFYKKHTEERVPERQSIHAQFSARLKYTSRHKTIRVGDCVDLEELFKTLQDSEWHKLQELLEVSGLPIDKLIKLVQLLAQQGIIQYEESAERIKIHPEWKGLLPITGATARTENL